MGLNISQKLVELLKYADSEGNNNQKYLDNQQEVSVFTEKLRESVANGEFTADEAKEIWGLSTQYKAPESTESVENLQPLEPAFQTYDESVNTYVDKLNTKQRAEVTEMFNGVIDILFETLLDDLNKSMVMEADLVLMDDAIYHGVTDVAKKYNERFDKYESMESRIINFPLGHDYHTSDISSKVNEIAQEILGCSPDEFIQAHQAEIAEINAAFSGKMLPEQLEAKQNLSESALSYIDKSQKFEAKLRATDQELSDRIMQMYHEKVEEESNKVEEDKSKVRLNETVQTKDEFRSLDSELSQTLFSSAVSVASISGSGKIDIQMENVKNIKKILTDKGVKIEITYKDGSKAYKNMLGQDTTVD